VNIKELLIAPVKTLTYRALGIATFLTILLSITAKSHNDPVGAWLIILLVFFGMALAGLAVIKIISKKYYEEVNEGWKRLSIIFCSVAGLFSSFITCLVVASDRYGSKFEYILVPIFFLIGFFGFGAAILLVKSLYLWVQEGFNGKSQDVPVVKLTESSNSEIPTSDPVVTTDTPKSAAIKTNEYISGIGGWLYFLIISFMVLSPLKLVGQTLANFADALYKYPQLANNPQWQSIKIYTWCLIMVSVAFCITAGYRLWKNHEWSSVRFAIKNFFIFQPLITLGIYFVPAIVLGNIDQLDTLGDPQVIGGLVGYLIMTGIWTAYLLKSKRVANTYR
jgi:Protein of unknown function (DUF2569)